jgi:ATP-dependent DNA helicase RecQ
MEEFRPGQREVIRAVIAGKNVLAVLPTGAGKSLCFQLPGLHLPGTTIVVSPLISLMRDQREKLEEFGVEAVALNSHLTPKEEAEHLELIRREGAEFIYVTPERLTNPDFLESLNGQKIDVLVIDEAHCVSQWGHDFRPSYLSIHEAAAKLGNPPVLALTATATPEVAEDIQKQLRLESMETVRLSVKRENLFLAARVLDSDAEKAAAVAEIVREEQGSGIVYVSTVKQAEALYHELKNNGIDVYLYHGRMKKADREASQEAFMNGGGRLMIATNAFGMGIDKADIRFVIHYNFPASLEAYYQEAGRAGRDGAPSRCELLYLKKDKAVQALFLSRRYPAVGDLAALWKFLAALAGDGDTFPRDGLADGTGGFSSRKITLLLSHLKNLGLLEDAEEKGSLRLLRRDLSAKDLGSFHDEYRERADRDQEKLKTVIQYAQSALCRWTLVSRYFGEEGETETECGHCDNCRNPALKRVRVATTGVAA